MNRLLSCIAACFFFVPTAFAQDAQLGALGQLDSQSARVEVITALNVPTGAVETANEMLAAEGSRFSPCLTGSDEGPWLFRLALRANGRVRAAELVTPSSEASGAETLTSCLSSALQALRYRHLGASIEVRVSRNHISVGAGFGGLGLRGTGRGGEGNAIGLGSLGTVSRGNGMSAMRSTPRVRPGRAEVRGSLSREIIRRVIRRHRNEIRYCYELSLQQDPTLQGRVVIRFTISGTGAVTTAATTEVGAGLEEAASCIARATRRWAFPAPNGGGIVIVTYPFVLTPG